ncbi:MAG: CHRD domain-containing protein [Gammaproteobacteria bacterium]|nr:CHRD domain-containing protein [Gammaproteobacteria bacterium]
MRRRDFVSFAVGAGFAAAAGPLSAQGPRRFTARLGWVPISGAERADVAGRGSAAATLSRSRLSITGSFEGLPAAATAARLHQGVATGARGPAIADLEITRADHGDIEGEVELDAEQIAALRAGFLYVQVHAEGKGVPEDGSVLWGWLIPADRAR